MNEVVLFKDVVSEIIQFCVIAFFATLMFIWIFVKKKNNSKQDIKWQHKFMLHCIPNYTVFFIICQYILSKIQIFFQKGFFEA
jgi:uncharacterized membrane protein (GlpM family)